MLKAEKSERPPVQHQGMWVLHGVYKEAPSLVDLDMVGSVSGRSGRAPRHSGGERCGCCCDLLCNNETTETQRGDVSRAVMTFVGSRHFWHHRPLFP